MSGSVGVLVNFPPLSISLSFWVELVDACNSIKYNLFGYSKWFFFFLGKEKLAILNSWVQEFFIHQFVKSNSHNTWTVFLLSGTVQR